MKRSSALLVLAAASPCGAQSRSRIAGTYDFWLCKAANCASNHTSEAFVRGKLILSDTTLELTVLPDSARPLLSGMFGPKPLNACWAVERRTSRTTYAGGGGVGSTRWDFVHGDSARITFGLYHSPDAGHRVTASVVNGVLRGRGESSGAGVAEVHWATDTVVGIRIGPPDVRICRDASLQRWREVVARGRR